MIDSGDWYRIVVTNDYNMHAKSIIVVDKLEKLLMSLERGKRPKVWAYQQKKTLHKVFLIPPILFELQNNFLSDYLPVRFSSSIDSIVQDSIDGLHEPISFEM